MTEAFIGQKVAITFKVPQGRVVEGVVSQVIPDSATLVLTNALFRDSGHRFASWSVTGAEIADLQFLSQQIPQQIVKQPSPEPKHEPLYHDPAIVSISKPNQAPSAKPKKQAQHQKKPKPNRQDEPSSSRAPIIIDPDSFDRSQAAQPEIIEQLQGYQDKLQILEFKNKKRVEKVRREIDTIIQSTSKSTQSYKGQGWRQTPMLKQVNNGKKGHNRKRNQSTNDDLAGWATEDATDIQEMGEFDFAGGLAKFDKHSVFEQLRQEDKVPTADRLVGHNKLKSPAARPGTFGGKNLHPSENVLDTVPKPVLMARSTSRRGSARQQSPPSQTSEDNNLRTSSRLSSKVRQKRLPVRTNTGSSHRLDLLNTRVPSSTSNENIKVTPVASPAFPTQNLNLNFISSSTHEACPVIAPGSITALENLVVSEHSVPIQTMNENAGRSLAALIISEWLSRPNLQANGLGVITSSLPKVSPRNFSALFLVGNHRCGARALVAARHLRDRGISSVCCVLGLDRPGNTLSTEVNTQLAMIRAPEASSTNASTSIVVASWREVTKYLAHTENTHDVWIDAILAPGHSYDTLVPEEQAAVVEMIDWANHKERQPRKTVFSIDVPCGINANTGGKIISKMKFHIKLIRAAKSVIASDNSIIQIHSDAIICMGAASTGLLNAMRNAAVPLLASTESFARAKDPNEVALRNARIYVADIGINEIWKLYGEQLGLATGNGVDFGLQWSMGLTLGQIDDDEDEENDVYDQ
jgi:enhancer of mRNA-decapping protein 3